MSTDPILSSLWQAFDIVSKVPLNCSTVEFGSGCKGLCWRTCWAFGHLCYEVCYSEDILFSIPGIYKMCWWPSCPFSWARPTAAWPTSVSEVWPAQGRCNNLHRSSLCCQESQTGLKSSSGGIVSCSCIAVLFEVHTACSYCINLVREITTFNQIWFPDGSSQQLDKPKCQLVTYGTFQALMEFQPMKRKLYPRLGQFSTPPQFLLEQWNHFYKFLPAWYVRFLWADPSSWSPFTVGRSLLGLLGLCVLFAPGFFLGQVLLKSFSLNHLSPWCWHQQVLSQ